MAGVFIANNVFGQHFGLTQEQANGIAAVIQTVLVYAIPNKKVQ